MVGGRTGVPPQPSPVAWRVSRRTFLRTAAWATGAAVLAAVSSACDVRLEDDAPELPLLRRASIPDEALLIATFHEVTALAQMVGRIPSPPAQLTGLAALHATQAQVLHGRLSAGGVPDHVIAESGSSSDPTGGSGTTGSTTPGPAVSAPPPATIAALASAEGTAVTAAALGAVAAATAANRTVLTSIAAQRGAAAEALGSSLAWPAADPLPSAGARSMLEATRSVAFAFQVIAAQTSGAVRDAAQATRTELARREDTLLAMAGTGTPPASLGYVLPFPVTTPDAAQKLATTTLTALVAAGLGPLATLGTGPAALTELVRQQVQAQRLGRGWGVVAAPFPGMVYP